MGVSKEARYLYGNHSRGLVPINTITLRRDITLEKIDPKSTIVTVDVHDKEVDEEVDLDENKKGDIAKGEEDQLKSKEPKWKNPLEEPIPIPFPTVAKKTKMHEEVNLNVVQIFKKVEVTVPLFDTIQQVSKYVKFLKDVYTHKEKISELRMSMSGACVNIMPLSIYEKLNLAPLKWSRASFMLADKSIVLVVEDLTFSVDDESIFDEIF
ncbi:hypothetical protein AHAS_Ahas04G0125600 [Arachis hypogaea]